MSLGSGWLHARTIALTPSSFLDLLGFDHCLWLDLEQAWSHKVCVPVRAKTPSRPSPVPSPAAYFRKQLQKEDKAKKTLKIL